MSRRPRSRRPPRLPDPVPARSAAPGPPAEPRPRTPREQLVAARVAGQHPVLSREAVLQHAQAVVRGEPRATFDLLDRGDVDLDTVRGALTASHGFRFDTPRASIDPDCTVDAWERAVTRVLEVAAGGGRMAFATSRPASLLVHQQHLARIATDAGADVVTIDQYGPFHAHGRADRRLRWFDGVAALTDDETVFADGGLESAGEWCFAVGRVDLAVADRGFAAAMLATGVETVAFADLDQPALSVAAARGRPVHLVPLVETRPPAAYAPLGTLGAFLAGMAAAAVTHPSHSTTPAPGTYAPSSSGESEG